MTPDPVTVTAAALQAAEGARQALKVTETVSKAFDRVKGHVEQKSRELSLRFPEQTGEFSVALEIKSGFFGDKKVHFSIPNVIRISTHSFPAFKPEDQCISKVGDEYILDGSKLSKEVQTILMRFEYQLEESRFLDTLVQRSWQLDPRSLPDAKVDSYWLTAQLRHLSVLKSFFQRLELRGLECRVDVGVHQDVKTKIPHQFTRAVERAADFSKTRDREMLRRLAHDQQRDSKFATRQFDIITELQELFLPSRFRNYVDVANPFHFWECERGRQLFELPFLNLPKIMTVVSRTDLDLDDPARAGTLTYKKGEIRTAIEKIFV